MVGNTHVNSNLAVTFGSKSISGTGNIDISDVDCLYVQVEAYGGKAGTAPYYRDDGDVSETSITAKTSWGDEYTFNFKITWSTNTFTVTYSGNSAVAVNVRYPMLA